MKNKANRRMKEKTNTLSMLCVFPSRCCGGRSFVCVLSIFRLLGLKLMDIRRLFKCRRAAERQTLEKEKKRELCSLEAQCDSEASLSFCLFLLFLFAFLSVFRGWVSGGPPEAREHQEVYSPVGSISLCRLLQKEKIPQDKQQLCQICVCVSTKVT